MTIPTHVQGQLKAFQEGGDAANYYKTIAQYGHDYGNLAYEAATDSGLWGRYANNHLENKAREYGVSIDRNKIMRELMRADYQRRERNNWLPIEADRIRDYHHEVFDFNGLPRESWTGTFFDNRLGPASWCIGCNGVERQGQTPQDALNQLWDNLSNDWNGTFDEAFDFFQDALGDGPFSETMADFNLDATDSIELSGLVKALFQVLAMSAQGWMNIASWLQGLLESASEYPSLIVLDLDGDGIETKSVGSCTYFDHAEDGFAELTGWTGSDDGLWARTWQDANSKGDTDAGELFTQTSVCATGQAKPSANQFWRLVA